MKTHGMHGTPTYSAWASMMRRCYNSCQDNYKRYGGAGIKVCKRWHKFDNFYADVGVKPNGLTLDRIDSTKDYSPSNVRWAPMDEQNYNRKHVLKLKDGKVAHHVALENGVSSGAFHRRIQRGWDVMKAITKPMRGMKTIKKVEV